MKMILVNKKTGWLRHMHGGGDTAQAKLALRLSEPDSKAVFIAFRLGGSSRPASERADSQIQLRSSLPVGWGVLHDNSTSW
jgi:hypothetical protein